MPQEPSAIACADRYFAELSVKDSEGHMLYLTDVSGTCFHNLIREPERLLIDEKHSLIFSVPGQSAQAILYFYRIMII